jgi:hypothetical protein
MAPPFLPDSLQEAAHQLARRHVASRMVGGLQKRAGLADIQTALQEHLGPEGYDTLKRSLMGAGIGAGGGLLMNTMTSGRHKKSPWSSMASGAALGGIGGALTKLPTAWNAMTDADGQGAGLEKTIEAERVGQHAADMKDAQTGGVIPTVIQTAGELFDTFTGNSDVPASENPALESLTGNVGGGAAANPRDAMNTVAGGVIGASAPSVIGNARHRAATSDLNMLHGAGGITDSKLYTQAQNIAANHVRDQITQRGASPRQAKRQLRGALRTPGPTGSILNNTIQQHRNTQPARPRMTGKGIAGRGLMGALGAAAGHYFTGD